MSSNRHSRTLFTASSIIILICTSFPCAGHARDHQPETLVKTSQESPPESPQEASPKTSIEAPSEASLTEQTGAIKNAAASASAHARATVSENESAAAKASTTVNGSTTVETNASKDQPRRKPRIGLALGGGGTRGSAHIGVLRTLEKAGIKIDCISGTSIGAIVGGLYCAGLSVDEIQTMFLNRKLLSSYQTVPIWVRVAVIPVFVLPHLIGFHHYDGLYRGNKFAKFLEKSVQPECRLIENLKIPFCAVASSLIDGKSHAIKSGCLARAIQASSAIPVLRRPVEIDGDLFVDGGIIDNLPARQVRELGADIVIAVDVDETFSKTGTRADLAKFERIGSVGNRVISMILRRVDEDQVARADVLIQPNVNEISLLSERIKEAELAIKQGEVSAEAQLPAIRAAISSFEIKN